MRFPVSILLVTLPLLGQEAFTLPGGLRVRLFENHERPYVEVRAEIVWDREDERGSLEGTGTFLGAVLEAGGAGPYTPAAWRRALDGLGIFLRFEAHPGRYLWTLQCPSGSQEAAFEFLAHAMARPLLDGPGVEIQRTRLFKEGQRRTPSEWAEERFRWEFLEGRPEGLLNESRLARLSLDQLQQFQSLVLRPERTRLAIYGDLSPAQTRQLTQLHLGIWGPTPRTRPAGVNPVPGPSPAGLALAQGRPEARLALLAPDGNGEVLALLTLLLDQWIQHPAAAARGVDGRLLRVGDRPCLLLHASGPPGADPLQLLGALRAWVDGIASRPLGDEELALARRLRTSRISAAGLHPAHLLESSFFPAPSTSESNPATLKANLSRWLSPDRMRVLLMGIPALPKEHPALKGLGPIQWVRAKD